MPAGRLVGPMRSVGAGRLVGMARRSARVGWSARYGRPGATGRPVAVPVEHVQQGGDRRRRGVAGALPRPSSSQTSSITNSQESRSVSSRSRATDPCRAGASGQLGGIGPVQSGRRPPALDQALPAGPLDALLRHPVGGGVPPADERVVRVTPRRRNCRMVSPVGRPPPVASPESTPRESTSIIAAGVEVTIPPLPPTATWSAPSGDPSAAQGVRRGGAVPCPGGRGRSHRLPTTPGPVLSACRQPQGAGPPGCLQPQGGGTQPFGQRRWTVDLDPGHPLPAGEEQHQLAGGADQPYAVAAPAGGHLAVAGRLHQRSAGNRRSASRASRATGFQSAACQPGRAGPAAATRAGPGGRPRGG